MEMSPTIGIDLVAQTPFVISVHLGKNVQIRSDRIATPLNLGRLNAHCSSAARAASTKMDKHSKNAAPTK